MDDFYFDFKRSEHFIKNANSSFMMDDLGICEIYLVGESCFDNYSECVTDNLLKPELKEDSEHINLPLQLLEDGSDYEVRILEDTTLDLSDKTSIAVKGIFITYNDYVMYYSINTYSVNISEQVFFEEGTLIESDVEDRG